MSDSYIEMSPIQLKQLLFRRVIVEAVEMERLPKEVWAPNFDMTGVVIQNHIEVTPLEVNEAGYKRYVVAVVFRIPNADEDSTVAPYKVDVEAQALFEAFPMEDEKKREDLVRINGASVIIGAIREQVTQLTARSVYGPLTLPTLKVLPLQTGE